MGFIITYRLRNKKNVFLSDASNISDVIKGFKNKCNDACEAKEITIYDSNCYFIIKIASLHNNKNKGGC